MLGCCQVLLKFLIKQKIRLLLKYKKKISSLINNSPLFEEENSVIEISTISIESIIEILREKKNYLLSQDVEKYVRFVSFENGILLINFDTGYPRELLKNLNNFFVKEKYNIQVEHSNQLGEDTVFKKKQYFFNNQLREISENPILKEMMRSFKNSYVAKIEEIQYSFNIT